MDYTKHYNSLIERAQQRTELHHIVPRSIGGGGEASNLIRLTAREHYVAHQLLVKMYPWHGGLAHAAYFMTVGLGRKNNRFYAWVREKHARAMSISQTGEGNSQYGTCWITNGNENKKISLEEEIPEGWSFGRSAFMSEESKRKISESSPKSIGRSYQ